MSVTVVNITDKYLGLSNGLLLSPNGSGVLTDAAYNAMLEEITDLAAQSLLTATASADSNVDTALDVVSAIADADLAPASVTATGAVTAASVVADVVVIPEAASAPVNAVKAQGTITISGGIPVADETFVVGGVTYTFKASRSGTGEVTIGIDEDACVANIATAINTDDGGNYTATENTGTDTVVVEANVAGVSGNDDVFTESATNMTMNGSGVLGATQAGVDGTVADTAFTLQVDGDYAYFNVAANTIADANWRRVALGSAY